MDVKEETERAGVLVVEEDDAVGGASERASETAAEDVLVRLCVCKKCSQTGTRTRVCWVRASHPNHLDYLGSPHTKTCTSHHIILANTHTHHMDASSCAQQHKTTSRLSDRAESQKLTPERTANQEARSDPTSNSR